MATTTEPVRHFLGMTDLSAAEVLHLLDEAQVIKRELKETGVNLPVLAGKSLAMIFEKPSLRTRVSFEIGMTQLGGHALYLAPADIGLGTREPISDVGRVLSSMADVVMARTFAHQTVVDLSRSSSVPVINALSDHEHPCQILADFLTILEEKQTLQGLTLAYVGDAENNVTHSLCLGAALLGMHFRVGAPIGYQMTAEVVKQAAKLAKTTGVSIEQTTDPREAVAGADVVITDTWVSMGDEAEKEARLSTFGPYQVTSALMRVAKPDAIFLHCLPAYRGNEVEAAVIDGPQSVAFAEAENRLHAQKALILKLLQIEYPHA